jgi:hypothetical protein
VVARAASRRRILRLWTQKIKTSAARMRIAMAIPMPIPAAAPTVRDVVDDVAAGTEVDEDIPMDEDVIAAGVVAVEGCVDSGDPGVEMGAGGCAVPIICPPLSMKNPRNWLQHWGSASQHQLPSRHVFIRGKKPVPSSRYCVSVFPY